MSEPTNQNTGSQGNQGQQGNVAGVNYGVQKTYNVSEYRTPQQRQIDRDICRQMLEEQMQLTSNTVIGRVYGNRNLIDEDLFVDLALVKPTRSQNPKDPQEIDPERGSDVFTPPEETIEKRFAYREFLQEVIDKRTDTEKKKIAIIGEPGAGKTTLLQKLAFWLLLETNDLVIWVSLGELGSQSLREYLEEKWLKLAFGQSREEIKADWEQKFKRGAVWLLLDGLDEMSQSHQQALKFGALVTDAQMIVTCRLNLWQANPSQFQGFQTYLTQPFQDEQMQEFIHRWFPGLFEAVEADQLAESLESELQAEGKKRIKDLCRNPLRLTLLCATWQGKKGALPDTTAKLYKKFVNYIYKWNKKEFTVTPEESKRLNAVLGELAKASLDREGTKFCLNHQLVCDYLGQPDDNSLLDMALNLGWLNKVGNADEPEDLVYVFYHATFQEYFAALAVENWNDFLPRTHVNRPVEGKYRIFEPQWKQVILLWLGRDEVKEEKEGFIRAVVEFKSGVSDFYYYQAYFLAAAGINEFKACSLATDIVREVVKCGFGEFDTQKQEWQTFLNPIEKGARKAIPETIRKLAILELSAVIENCPEEDIRGQAAWSLGVIDAGNIEAIAGLLEVIHTTEDEDTRRQAAWCLGEIGQRNPEEIAALVKVIGITENKHNRRQAIESLGKIGQGNPLAIAGLLTVIGITEDKHSHRQAIESLEKIGQGNPLAIAGLLTVIGITENEDIRRQAIESLGKIGQGNPEAITALVKVIGIIENENIRRLAAFSLGKIGQGNPEAIATLVKVINAAENEHTSWVAAWSLGNIDPGNLEAISALVKVIGTTENEDTRRLTAVSLGEIDPGNPEAIAALVKVIGTTKNEDTRWVAAESLGKIDPGNLKAIAALLNLIATTENEHTWWRAALSLGKIGQGNPEAIAGLVNFIATTENEDTRWRAAESLGKIGQGNPEAIAGLLNLIATTENEDTRWRAAESLGKILITPEQYAGVVSALKDCLSDEVYENNFDRFDKCYKVIWNCAENLPYPEFYEAWHKPLTTSHSEVTEQTQVGHNSTVDSLETQPIDICLQLQNLPIFCLDATILTDETEPSEIAQTLCQLIWEKAFLDEDYPKEVTTASKLREQLKTLNLRQNLPKLPILITHCHPSSELIAFCRKLTNIVAIAWLTDEPLEAPLKGFPPNQPHLISAIQTWLEEI